MKMEIREYTIKEISEELLESILKQNLEEEDLVFKKIHIRRE